MWTAPPGPAHSPETRTFSGTNTTPSGRVQLPTESRTTYLHDPYLNRSLNVADSNTLPTHQDFPTYQQESGITPDTQANPQAHQPTLRGGISASAPIPPLQGPAAHPVGDPCLARLWGSPVACGSAHCCGCARQAPGPGWARRVGRPVPGAPRSGHRFASSPGCPGCWRWGPSWHGPLILRDCGAPNLDGWPLRGCGWVRCARALAGSPWVQVTQETPTGRVGRAHGHPARGHPSGYPSTGIRRNRRPAPPPGQGAPRRPDASGPAAGGPQQDHHLGGRIEHDGPGRVGSPDHGRPTTGGHDHRHHSPPQAGTPTRRVGVPPGRPPSGGASSSPQRERLAGYQGYSKCIVNRATLGHPTRAPHKADKYRPTQEGAPARGQAHSRVRHRRETVHRSRRRRGWLVGGVGGGRGVCGLVWRAGGAGFRGRVWSVGLSVWWVLAGCGVRGWVLVGGGDKTVRSCWCGCCPLSAGSREAGTGLPGDEASCVRPLRLLRRAVRQRQDRPRRPRPHVRSTRSWSRPPSPEQTPLWWVGSP